MGCAPRHRNLAETDPIDHQRYSAIAHGELIYWNPIDPERLGAWLGQLPLGPGSRALDVGCGRGALLLDIAARHGCQGVGVDSHPAAIEHARAASARQPDSAAIEWICGPFDVAAQAPASFDLVACLGAGHACGGFAQALETLTPLLIPGGQLLVGEGFWAREPDPGYLAFLGAGPDDLLTHEGNRQLAEQGGLVCRRSHAASPAEWSHYEDTYAANVVAHVAAHPDDPEAATMTERIDAWRDAYLRWGRQTLGFGLYLFEKPSGS